MSEHVVGEMVTELPNWVEDWLYDWLYKHKKFEEIKKLEEVWGEK
jgi:hypothetical protein